MIGIGSGKTRSEETAAVAVLAPLLDVMIDRVMGVVFNMSGGKSMSLEEVDRTACIIYNNVDYGN